MRWRYNPAVDSPPGVKSLALFPQPGDDRARAALAATAVGMAILGTDGRWQHANPALVRLLDGAPGAPCTAGSGTGSLFDVVDPAEAAVLRAEVAGLLAGGAEAIDRGVLCRRSAGPFTARINLAVLRDDAGRADGLVLQLQPDADAEAAVELALMRRQMQAQVDAVAHDLRAPLRAIENFTGLLVRKLEDGLDASARDQFGRIRGAASRMARLLDGLGELSRATTTPLKPVPVDLSLLADWVIAEQQDAHPEREFQVTVQPGLAAHGDEHLLKTMLARIVDNARRFSRDDAPVIIDVVGTEMDGVLRLSVRDHGRGFDMRYRHKLFEPFQRLHGGDEGAGDGLGLAIAQRIAARHGGHIDAESDADTGSVFHIQLPAAHAADASPGE